MKKRKLVVFAQPGVGGAERMSVTVTKNLDVNTFNVFYYLIGKWQGDKAPLERFIPKRHEVHLYGHCDHAKSGNNPPHLNLHPAFQHCA